MNTNPLCKRNCNNAKVGNYDNSQCFRCWLLLNNYAIRKFYGLPIEPHHKPDNKSVLCHHLGRRLVQGDCKGNCNHYCDAYSSNEEVKNYLDSKVLLDKVDILPQNYAIPNKTCVDCPGKEV